jgi:hypothetical protein
MITVHPQRARPQDRIQSESQKPVMQQVARFPAPIAGWVTNENLASQRPDSAYVLDNFWVNRGSIAIRGGSQAHVDVTGDIVSLHNYSAGAEFYAADATAIYEFEATTANGTTLSPVVSGQSSGAWISTETQNDAGSFLTLVNGDDDLQLYDGSTWYTVTLVSATHSITGSGLSGTDAFKYVWNYRNRVWFVQKESMNAWYLGVNSVSGAATKFPLAGVFRKGGTLHSGASFSLDSGDGPSNMVVFMSSQGEIAIYQGDPAIDFSLVGLYDVGVPLSTEPYVQIGGDLLIATRAGLIPVTGAIQKSPAELKITSVSLPIEPDWEYWSLLQPTGWKVAKWAERGAAIFVVPDSYPPMAFVLNLETGAWSRWTNWDAAAVEVLGGQLYLANGDTAYIADTSGADQGTAVTAKMCTAFHGLADGPSHKEAKRVRGSFRRDLSFNPQFSIGKDYTTDFPAIPTAATLIAIDGAPIWDVAKWDETFWGIAGRAKGAKSQWHVVEGHGFALGVQLQITSPTSVKLDTELVAYDLTYTMGDT